MCCGIQSKLAGAGAGSWANAHVQRPTQAIEPQLMQPQLGCSSYTLNESIGSYVRTMLGTNVLTNVATFVRTLGYAIRGKKESYGEALGRNP